MLARFVRLLADQRGAVAFETPIVVLFMMLSLLMPLADLAIAGLQFISGYQALRDLGQYLQYHPPTDVTNWSGWAATVPTSVGGYAISSLQVLCGDTSTACSTTNTVAVPRSYSFTTTVTLSPLVLRPVFCPNTLKPTPCTFTLRYAERFQ